MVAPPLPVLTLPSDAPPLCLPRSTRRPANEQVGLLPAVVRLADLYAMVFGADDRWRDEPLPCSAEKLGAALERFLARVALERFPVEEVILEYDPRPGAGFHPFLTWMPLYPQGRPCDDEEEAWVQEEPGRLLWHLVEGDLAGLQERYGLLLSPAFDPRRLAASLRQLPLPPPLRGLPDLVEYLRRDTGNWWLDVCPDCWPYQPDRPEWEPELVETLHEEWRAARERIAAIRTLSEWVAASVPRLATVEYYLTLADRHARYPHVRQLSLFPTKETLPDEPPTILAP